MSSGRQHEQFQFQEPVRVIMHLPEGWTKVLLIRTHELGLADGGIYWDIPTERIPHDLRKIGTVFLLEGSDDAYRIENTNERYVRRFETLRIRELTRDELAVLRFHAES